MNMAMEVHDDRNDCYVGGGFRLDRVRVIYVRQLGLPEGVRIVKIVAGKIQKAKYVFLGRMLQEEIGNANGNGLCCERSCPTMICRHV